MNKKYDPKNPDENKNQIAGHWEKYVNKHYMGASALYISDGKYAKITVTIVGVYNRTVYDKATNSGKPVVVAALKGKQDTKEMILNVTNMKRIELLLNTPEMKNWVGQSIPLGAEFVNSGNGRKVWALRVNPKNN